VPAPGDWIDRLLVLPLDFKAGNRSIRQLFEEVKPPKLDRETFTGLIAERLRMRPELIDAWQTYSYDKRSSPCPYLDGLEVGFFDGERRDVSHHEDMAAACADYVVRETESVLRDR
jgi:hypothetical protein